MTASVESTSRLQLFRKLKKCIARSKREGRGTALILVGVRRLRDINIELGYEAGDLALGEVFERIRGLIRRADVVLRVGDTEFAVILPSLTSAAQAELAANRFREVCTQPVRFGATQFKVQLALGLALYPDHGHDGETLLRCADIAMSKARESDGGFTMYTQSDRQAADKLALAAELEEAIDNGDVALHFQPQVHLRTGCLTGVEALARWTSPSQGPIRPDIFIDVAEQGGLIVPFTLWVLNSALRQCQRLRRAGPEFLVSVNLSASVLNDAEIVELVQRARNIWSSARNRLTLEITENAMMVDPEASLRVLEQLSEAGVRLSIDDFGTGYSSMAYLKKLPVDELKIDKSFVLNMMSDSGDARIVEGMINLAHDLGLSVVAEGIEDLRTFDRLAQLGCDYGQGFHIAKPMPVTELGAWLKGSPYRLPDARPRRPADGKSAAGTGS